MTTTPGHRPSHSAPVLDRRYVDYINANPHAVAVQSLIDGTVSLHTSRVVDPFDAIDVLVLVTIDDVRAHTAQLVKAGKTVTSKRVADSLNLELFAMHARGEFPTLEDIEQVIAEMSAMSADIIDIHRGA